MQPLTSDVSRFHCIHDAVFVAIDKVAARYSRRNQTREATGVNKWLFVFTEN
jgi:hypothetical protein